jgi:predicted nuclease of predicted toxin-antitoxin system
MPDSDIFRKAATEGRVLLTFDLDFGEILALSRERAVSVVLFRLRNTRTPHVIERLKVALEETKEMLESGSVVVVEESRLRTRRLPLRR